MEEVTGNRMAIGKREFIATLLMAGYTRTPMLDSGEWYSHTYHDTVEFDGRTVYFPSQNRPSEPHTLEEGFRVWKKLHCMSNLARSHIKQLEEEARQAREAWDTTHEMA